MKNTRTLSETMHILEEEGYTLDFNLDGRDLVRHQKEKSLSPEQYKIDKVYRFEGQTNPDDQSILYAISSDKLNIKGVLVNGYGISSDSEIHTLIEKLKIHPSEGGN